MRILHTSDWHLGRSFHRVGLLDAQAGFVDHLLATVESEQVDLVVVSGDVYDRALPSVDAVGLADETFARLAASRATTVVTSGNHDSQIRLGFNSRLADAAGVHLRTRWQDVGSPVVLEDAHGPVAVYGLPYLEPDAVRDAWRLESRSHEATLGEAMRRVHADLAGRPGTRSVVMAHAFVAGSAEASVPAASDSERDISVGGLQIAPTDLFTGVDYAALGHLHGRHVLTDTVRYSGSPLAYSFSEARHTKGSWLVELGQDGVESADFVPAPVPRSLRSLRGPLEDLLRDPALADAEDSWLQVTLTDARRPMHAMERLRDRFPHTLLLAFEPEGVTRSRGPVLPRVDGRSDLDVALGFVAEVRDLEATTEEALLLQLACDSCRITEDDLDPATGRSPAREAVG
ncbi:exonuclease SbcCD subunit D [Nocardioides mesophilus]|uniref:Nuclease SbcCD subunit D n=1 Tax=Nocardioides mesophilus TaxID=433659 RepID=A0A7G9RAS9_9ACTN|nr:exonuclease SbcCD subunit D [Nocardioides mesophilus]QNN52704.1 exonuclease SbcCD subunit D [Nocardioides mesophilus]